MANQFTALQTRALPAGRYRVRIDGEEARQGQAIFAAVRRKEAEDKDAQGDAAIRAAAQPLAHQWKVLP